MIFTTLMRVSYLRSRTHSEPAQGKPASPRGSFLPKMRVQFSKSPTISAFKCKTTDCENFIPQKYLGIYDPNRITVPECGEETFRERCSSCRKEHSYKVGDAVVFFVSSPPPLAALRK